MKTKLLVAIGIAVAVGFGAGWFVGHKPATKPEETPQPQAQQANVPVMPPPREPDITQLAKPTRDVVRIPLDKVYTTSRQKGLKPLPEPPDKNWEASWKPLFRMLDNTWLSNTFLVVSPDIYGAMNETRSRYETLNRSHPLDIDDPRTSDLDVGPTLVWLFVFLGSGAEDEGWTLQDVEVQASKISVRVQGYQAAEGGFGFSTRRGQAWWVPIPRPAPRSHVVIVIEDDSDKPPLVTRRVQIK